MNFLKRDCLVLPRSVLNNLILVATLSTLLIYPVKITAQTCENIPDCGPEGISAQITISGTTTPVADGMFVPAYTTLRIDSVASAFGSCTGMAWFCNGGCTCSPTGYVYQRNINHTNVWVDISTATSLNGAYSVGKVWGRNSDQNVLDTESSESTGPNYLTVPYAGSYKIHIQGIINAPCGMTPDVTDDLVITVNVANNDDATDFGAMSCNSGVGEPVNVTNGNVFIQQTDYRLPGLGEGLGLTRTYNSLSPHDGMFGHGWTSTYEESLNIYGTLVSRLNLSDGRAVYFSRSSTTAPYLPAPSLNFQGQIVQNLDNTYTLTFKDGRVHQFSAAGKLLSMADRNGVTTTLTYDGNGYLIAVTDASGRTLTFTYGYWDMVNAVSDSLGTVATYGNYRGFATTVRYPDSSGFNFGVNFSYEKLTYVSDVLGNILESHEYGPYGVALTSEIGGNGTEKYTLNYISATETDVTDALGHLTKYFFDKSKGRAVVTRVEGSCSCNGPQIQTWTYDDQLNVTAKSDALNHTTSYTYDSSDNRLTETDATGTVTYTYNSFGEVLTRTDQMNGVWTNTYDTHGNLLTTEDPLHHTTALSYNSQGQLLTATDPRNNVTSFAYDTNGNLTRRTDALNHETNIAYDARGRVTSVTNALNEVTSYEYDLADRLKKVIYPDTNFVLFTFDLAGRRTKVKDPRGYETNFGYDSAHRLTSETNADNKTTSYSYDLMSNLTGVTDALNRTTNYEYDDFNRLKKIKHAEATPGAGRLEENFTYDFAGNLLEKKDQLNRITSFCYDPANRLTTTTDAALKVTTYEYNPRSQLTGVVDAINQRYEFSYDPLGHVTENKKSATTMTFVYDPAGNRSQRTDYNGAVTNYSYDELNRLTTISYPDTTSAVYGYDVLSRVTTATNPTGTVTIGYDNRGRVSSVTDVFGQVVSYQYDPNSNRTQLNLNGALNASYQYDVINRLTQLTDNASLNTTFSYDATNKLSSRTLPNGVVSTYQYDGLNRLTRLTHAKGANTLADFQYQFNDVNNITQMIDNAGTHNYSYDPLDRLTAATHPNQQNESYTYDDVGNRTASHQGNSYSYQPFNRLITANGTSFSYDTNGNETSKSDSNGSWTYIWDYENRLKQASLSGGVTVTYSNDALGRRIQRTSSTGGITKFVYDGIEVLRDLDSNNGTLSEYLNGPGIDNKFRQATSTSAAYFLSDRLHSNRVFTDTSGNASSASDFDSFGNVTSGPTMFSRYSYTGREIDLDVDLSYNRARWYDSKQGRFISEDPIGFLGGDINLYGYVWRSPLNHRDSLGLDGWGNDVADWLDQKIEFARQYWQYCDQEWLANGINNSVADVAFGFSDLLRVGSGLGRAIYAEDENGYGRAAFVAQDVARASGLFGLLASPSAGYNRSSGTCCRSGIRAFISDETGSAPNRYSGRYADGQKAYRTNVPREPTSNTPAPLPEASGPHSRLNFDAVDPKRVYSATEFDGNGNAVGRTDFAARRGQSVPHYHPYDPATKGFGTKTPCGCN